MSARLHVRSDEDLKDTIVSEASRWHDEEWRFPVTVAGTSTAPFKLRWTIEVEPGVLLTDPRHANLLDAWRRVVFCLITEPGDKQMRRMSICGKLGTSLRSLVPFMYATHRSDLSHLDRRCFAEYTDHLVSKAIEDDEGEEWDERGITADAMTTYAMIFTYAWWARGALAEAGLPHPPDEDPLSGRSTVEWALGICRRVSQETPEIPDQLFVAAVNKAALFIEEAFVEPLIELCNDLPGLGKERMTALCEVFVRDHLPDCDPYDPAQGSVRGLVTRMRTACNMLLQGLSGIRVSELCGIPAGVWNEEIGLPGAIEIERTFDDEYELFYLVAEVFKDSGSSEPGKWILGMRPTGSDYLPLPVKAAQILHRLDAGWRASSGVDRLVVNFTGSVAFPSVEKAVSPTLGNTLRYWQRRWLTETGHLGEDDRLTTHMWRKTWARYMVRVSGGLLPAISHHFKHLSVAFTEVAYCQPRAAARQIISDARVAEAGETILGVITGETPVEGPVARELRDLAVEMRGRFANRPAYERRNDVSEALRIRNIQVYRADFGICVFRGDGARCHLLADDPRLPLLRMAPAFARQTPDVCAGCRNFGIDRRHRQFWVERLEKARHRAASYGSDAPRGVRSADARMISRCETVLGWMGGSDDAA